MSAPIIPRPPLAPQTPWAPLPASAWTFGLLAAVCFCASMAGVMSRPLGHLAAFWPTNAVLLGLLVRFPALATRSGAAGALLGYLLAGWLSGDPLKENLLLTLGNLVGVLVAVALLNRLDASDRSLMRPASVLRLLAVLSAASLAAAGYGAVVEPYLFDGHAVGGATMWFVVEVTSYVAIVPVLLTLPSRWDGLRWRRWRGAPASLRALVGPVLALGLSGLLGLVVGGPGAVAFPIVALLWCGLSLGLFATSVLALLYSAWMLLAVSNGLQHLGDTPPNEHLMLSLRLAVAVMASGPLVVASVTAARQALLQQLRHLAEHDAMTGITNRRAFLEQAGTALADARAARRAAGVLIFDIDHFKKVNDTHGHGVGDQVIVRVAQCARAALPAKGAFLGRLGGEEFGVCLTGVTEAELAQWAERLRAACEASRIAVGDGASLGVTISLGGAWFAQAPLDLPESLQAADAALYRAKRAGRNRCEMAPAA